MPMYLQLVLQPPVRGTVIFQIPTNGSLVWASERPGRRTITAKMLSTRAILTYWFLSDFLRLIGTSKDRRRGFLEYTPLRTEPRHDKRSLMCGSTARK